MKIHLISLTFYLLLFNFHSLVAAIPADSLYITDYFALLKKHCLERSLQANRADAVFHERVWISFLLHPEGHMKNIKIEDPDSTPLAMSAISIFKEAPKRKIIGLKHPIHVKYPLDFSRSPMFYQDSLLSLPRFYFMPSAFKSFGIAGGQDRFVKYLLRKVDPQITTLLSPNRSNIFNIDVDFYSSSDRRISKISTPDGDVNPQLWLYLEALVKSMPPWDGVEGNVFQNNNFHTYQIQLHLDHRQEMLKEALLKSYYNYQFPVISARYQGNIRRDIYNNTQFPTTVDALEANIKCSYIVDQNGVVSDVEVLNPTKSDFDKEAIRAISSLSKWKPGSWLGKPVKCRLFATVSFKKEIEPHPVDVPKQKPRAVAKLDSLPGVGSWTDYIQFASTFHSIATQQLVLKHALPKGRVWCDYTVLSNGKVSHIDIVSSSDSKLEKYAESILTSMPAFVIEEEGDSLRVRTSVNFPDMKNIRKRQPTPFMDRIPWGTESAQFKGGNDAFVRFLKENMSPNFSDYTRKFRHRKSMICRVMLDVTRRGRFSISHIDFSGNITPKPPFKEHISEVFEKLPNWDPDALQFLKFGETIRFICLIPIATNPDQFDKMLSEARIVNDHLIVMPMYPQGNPALFQFIEENTQFPNSARVKGITSGLVSCLVLVDENGDPKDVKVRQSTDPAFEAEAIRVVSLIKKWIPAKKKGVTIERYRLIHVHFQQK